MYEESDFYAYLLFFITILHSIGNYLLVFQTHSLPAKSHNNIMLNIFIYILIYIQKNLVYANQIY